MVYDIDYTHARRKRTTLKTWLVLASFVSAGRPECPIAARYCDSKSCVVLWYKFPRNGASGERAAGSAYPIRGWQQVNKKQRFGHPVP